MRKTLVTGSLTKKGLATCLALLTATAALSGCGGSGSNSESTATAAPPEAAQTSLDAAAAKQANAICARAADEVNAATAKLPEAISHASSTEAGITDGVVRPGIAILEKESRDLQALRPNPEPPAFSTFVGLFEPVLVLAYERLASGEELNQNESRELENLAATLTAEQLKLASSLGLSGCETGFFEALGTTQ